MLRLIRCTGLFILLSAFILPVSGADVKKESKKIDDVDKSEKSEKTDKKGKEKETDPYVTVATLEGTVKQVGSGTKTFTVELVNRQLDPQDTAANAQRMQQLQVQLAQQRAQNNRGALAGTLQQIAQLQAKPPKFIEQKMDKQFEAAEDVKVRVSDLPVEFGDNGKAKKLTKAEIAEKKGPGNLWGFPAEFEQVTVGQHIRIMLAVKKSVYDAAKKKKKPAPAPKKGVKPMEEDMTGDFEDQPIVRQIHILADVSKK
jgi:hypothetical protein